MDKKVLGMAVSGGIAFGKAYVIQEHELTFDTYSSRDAAEELKKLQHALHRAEDDLQRIRKKVLKEQGADNAAIFDAQILSLHDPELLQAIKKKINTEKRTAESALSVAASYYIKLFEEMDDEYMRERAADLKDVMKRVLSHMLGIKKQIIQ